MKRRMGRRLQLSKGICIAAFALYASVVSPASSRARSPASGRVLSDQSQEQTETATAQTQEPSAAGKSTTSTTQSTTAQLESRVDLIPIRVVVRDGGGRPVASLHKKDFRVFEDRKPQDIAYFSTEIANPPGAIPQTNETADSNGEGAGPAIGTTAVEKAPGASTGGFVPSSHFVALLFDDVHITFGDLSQVIDAAIKFVDHSVQPADRVAVFTVSGESRLDFTTDRDSLRAALLGLRQRSVAGESTPGAHECPSIDYYQADRIVNHNDQGATNVAVYDELNCAYGDDPRMLEQAREMALARAREVNEAGVKQAEESLRRLEQVIDTVSSRPGQRTLVLVSPGFICPNDQDCVEDAISYANRLNVFINTLDARGVYAPDLGDASMASVDSQCQKDPTCGGGWLAARAQVRAAGASAQTQVLNALAEGTGGLGLHSNDLTGELRSLASLPDVSYLIAFTPHNLKYDGKFHKLKVAVVTNEHVLVQARRGFYDPR